MRVDNTSCCGLNEIVGVAYNSPQDVMRMVCEYKNLSDTKDNRDYVPLMFFTDTIYKKKPAVQSGQSFAKFIEDNKLGVLSKSTIRINPNSSNRIRCWIWSVNFPNLINWYKKNK